MSLLIPTKGEKKRKRKHNKEDLLRLNLFAKTKGAKRRSKKKKGGKK